MIVPYKNRMYDLNFDDPVEVYRNVNKKGVWYTIRQRDYVVAHADEVNLINAEFIVQPAGQKKVKKTGVKNVHAWVRGEIIKVRGESDSKPFQVKYNPKKMKTFQRMDTKKPIKFANFVVLRKEGVFADNTANM